MGTNVGALKDNLFRALDELTQSKIKITKKSKIYQTKPWGNVKQSDFLNIVLEVQCNYSPMELLRVLKNIEVKMGRREESRWGPRIIDLDILFYGNRIVNQNNLVIPHKEFYNRPFAIIPLAEISPNFIPPSTKKRIKNLALGVKSEGIEIYRN